VQYPSRQLRLVCGGEQQLALLVFGHRHAAGCRGSRRLQVLKRVRPPVPLQGAAQGFIEAVFIKLAIATNLMPDAEPERQGGGIGAGAPEL